MLAAFTIFAYIFHYFFEYGYLSYFDIPTALISFNLTEMIPAIFFLVVTYFIFVFGLWPLINDLLGVLPGFLKKIIIVSPLFLIVFLGFSWNIILLIFFSILLFFGIEPFRKYRARKVAAGGIHPDPNSNPLDSKSVETKPSSDPLVDKIIPNGNRFLLFYLLFIALVGSMALGRITAMTRTSFPVTDTSPPCAVVYTTTDRYICKPMKNTNSFENTFRIFYFQENQNVTLRNEAIGPLYPE